MTDQIGSMSLSRLSEFNFDDVDLIHSEAEANALLGKSGRVSLDDNGHLVMVNPKIKPDNALVRFFKGLFNPAYRAEQRVLQRSVVLACNLSFNVSLTRGLISYSTPGERSGGLSIWDQTAVKNLALSAADSTLPGGVTPEGIQELLENTASNYRGAVMSDAVKFVLEDSCFKNEVFYRGQALNALDFVKQEPPHGGIRPFLARSFGISAVMHCAMHPDRVQNIMPRAEGERLGVLLSSMLKSPQERAELSHLAQKAIAGFLDKLNGLTQEALDRGCDPRDTARLIHQACELIISDVPARFDDLIFNPQSPGSIANQLAALPAGAPPAPAEAKVQEGLNAVKSLLPGLDDRKAAKVQAFIASQPGMTPVLYHDFSSSFMKTLEAAAKFSSRVDYCNYHKFSTELSEAADRYLKAHREPAGFDAESCERAGAAAAFHAALTDDADSFISDFVKQGPYVRDSLQKLLNDPASSEYRSLSEAERQSLNALHSFMKGALKVLCAITDGSEGGFAAAPVVTPNISMFSLLLIDRVKGSEVQDLIRQLTDDAAPEVRRGLTGYLEEALRMDIAAHERFTPEKTLEAAKEKAQGDPKFMRLLSEWPAQLSADEERMYRNFLINDPAFGIGHNLENLLSQSSDYDAEGFHVGFYRDSVRGAISRIDGRLVGTGLNDIKAAFLQIVPGEFVRAVSALSMQGGLELSLGIICQRPELMGDGSRHEIDRLMQEYPAAIKVEHDSQLRREGDMLYLTEQMELCLSSMLDEAAEPFARFPISAELAINLAAGVDENGCPMSLVLTELGRKPVEAGR